MVGQTFLSAVLLRVDEWTRSSTSHSMRIPLRLSPQSQARKLVAAIAIAAFASVLSLGARHAPFVSIPLSKLDDLLYDSLYRLRPTEDRTGGPVVIVAVDDKSLQELRENGIGKTSYGWPWPRQFWGYIAQYLDKCGARAVAFDVLFNEPSVFNHFDADDTKLAKMVDACKAPVVFAVRVGTNGKPTAFALPVKRPLFGAVNVGDDVMFRRYPPMVNGVASLASQAVAAVGGNPSTEPFLLHYYGPHQKADGKRTFRYVAAAHVLATSVGQKNTGVSPEMFRDRIVLIGTITAGTYDLKSSPLSREYPGVEVQATAVENLLSGQRVRAVSAPLASSAAFVTALLAAAGVTFPRRVSLKLLDAALAAGALVAVAIVLFLGHRIYWLPLAAPLVALLLSTVGAFAWSYVAEDRQRRIIFRALSQSLSPEMAEQIQRNPDKLKLGGERRIMSVMFTDIAGFTDLSEQLDGEKLTALINFYLEEMSAVVLGADAYLDKYIGDAIMSFWNAPLDQPDHAILACRAALAVRQREQAIQEELRRLGATRLLTRIGINTGPMTLGNMGSSLKFAYTVLGDSVNLASRLEGANKIYGSQILLAEPTAELVKDMFVVRRLDLLQVKGKQKPMAVYELMADGRANGELQVRVTEYEAAWRSYRDQKWDEAEAQLRALYDRFPGDAPAAALMRRIADLRQDPPGPDWDGVYVAKGK